MSVFQLVKHLPEYEIERWYRCPMFIADQFGVEELSDEFVLSLPIIEDNSRIFMNI